MKKIMCLMGNTNTIRMILILLSLLIGIFRLNAQQIKDQEIIYMNADLPINTRVIDLVSRMTLEEKISQVQYTAAAIPRLGIPEYNWWNECLHGVARNGIATVFPQAIGMAATWNPDLIHNEASVISTEARAKYNEAVQKNERGIYQGLTFWSPNINIFRDPRWGRGQETYGEDPFLTAEIGKAFVKGLQGDDPKYLKVVATAKHFAVHSGPESERHRFDAWPSLTDLYETYLPAFEALVKEASVSSIMSSYNRVFGTPSSANSFLLDQLLREKWGFKGYVVSDCWAISDFYNFHKFVPTAEQAASLAIRAGCDLACGPEYGSLMKAFSLGYLSENDLDIAVKRLFEARFRLGLFDPPGMVRYASITHDQNNTEEHRQLARKIACESMVLLKNHNGILPLRGKIRTIAVIGPYAADTSVLLGNYNGTPSAPVTILQGIRNNLPGGCRLVYAKGVDRPEEIARIIEQNGAGMDDLFNARIQEAIKACNHADVILFVGGISPNLEGEEMNVKVPGFSGGDRTDIEFPATQQVLMEALVATGKPVILIITNGSAMAINWADQHVSAILEAWYPGEEGGNAVADILFGKYNPAGRLPVTFYRSVNDLPAFDNYSMEGRTYRYFRNKPLYEFGFGLSYTTFVYGQPVVMKSVMREDENLEFSVTVSNTGKMDGDEVIQVYLTRPEGNSSRPVKSLIAFKRVSIPAGKSATTVFTIPASRFRHYDPGEDDYTVTRGDYTVMIGSSSRDIRQKFSVLIK